MHILKNKIVLGSGSVDPHFFADPDPESQNNADPADPDPKHCMKGTVCVIFSDSQCKDDNAWF